MNNGELHEETVGRPSNAYAHSKNALREQLSLFKKSHPFELAWARLFYVYGNGQGPKSLVPQLAASVKRGQRRFPMSFGDQLRDYLIVDSMVSKILSIALDCKDVGIVNICSGRPISVRTLVENIMKANNWDIELELGKLPYSDYEPFAFWGSNAKFQSLVEFNRQ